MPNFLQQKNWSSADPALLTYLTKRTLEYICFILLKAIISSELSVWSLIWKRSLFYLQEYSEDDNSEPDVDLENQYYNSKALKEEDTRLALESFQRVCCDYKQCNCS